MTTLLMKSADISENLSAQATSETTKGVYINNSPLHFEPITLDAIPEISRILSMSPSLTCDYSIGGIYMWINYFRYKYCIYRETLFITGVEENRLDRRAFSCPVGSLPFHESIRLIEEYCRERDLELCFSAVPADRISQLMSYSQDFVVEELTDWADYVYDIESFVTLSGKKYAGKRNHVNRFKIDFPQSHLDDFTIADVAEVKECLSRWTKEETIDMTSPTRVEELDQVFDVLDNMDVYKFDGALLRAGGSDDRIVAFAFGEKINNTMFVHIEKMDHGVSGAGEAIAHMFASRMSEKYKDLQYLNREEDCGDQGLRYAKQSWHPSMLLRKYNVVRQ